MSNLDEKRGTQKRLVFLEPKPEDYVRLGDLYFEKEEHLPAMGCYSKAVEKDARYKAAWVKRAKVCKKLREWSELAKCYSRLAELEPTRANFRYEKLVRVCGEAVALWPEDTKAMVCLATAYRFLGQQEKSAECCEKLAKKTERKERWLQRAIFCYNTLIEAEPGSLEPRIARGRAYGELGKYVRAAKDYAALKEMDSSNAAAWNELLCDCYRTAAGTLTSVDSQKKLIALFRKNGAYSEIFGCYASLEAMDAQNADRWNMRLVEYCERLISQSNEKGLVLLAWEALAGAYLRQEDYESSEQCYGELKLLDSENEQKWSEKAESAKAAASQGHLGKMPLRTVIRYVPADAAGTPEAEDEALATEESDDVEWLEPAAEDEALATWLEPENGEEQVTWFEPDEADLLRVVDTGFTPVECKFDDTLFMSDIFADINAGEIEIDSERPSVLEARLYEGRKQRGEPRVEIDSADVEVWRERYVVCKAARDFKGAEECCEVLAKLEPGEASKWREIADYCRMFGGGEELT